MKLFAVVFILSVSCSAPESSAAGKREDNYLMYRIPANSVERPYPVRINPVIGDIKRYWLGNQLVGERQYYHEGELYSETPYKDGQKHGVERIWFKNKRLAFESPYKEGLMHGLFRQWDAKGVLLGTYQMNLGTGTVTTWHKNGQVESKCEYAKNLLHGRCREWFDNGKMYKDETYLAGKLDGPARYWNRNGRQVQETSYKAGKMHGVLRIWNENGELIEGSPTYWVEDRQVSRTEYLGFRQRDPSLPQCGDVP